MSGILIMEGADEYVDVDLSPSRKTAHPQDAGPGTVVTFTIVLRNRGSHEVADAVLFDAIPDATAYVQGSAQASSGVVSDTGGIHWRGAVAADSPVTITFRVAVGEAVPIVNTAVLEDGCGSTFNLVAMVNARRVYLPLVTRGFTP